jgi:hypothetical protein
LDYYIANGTTIDPTTIPFWEANLLVNPGMEGSAPLPPTTGWTRFGTCTLASNTVKKVDGLYSLKATGRTTAAAGPCQDIRSLLANGLTYNVGVNTALANVQSNGRLVIEYKGCNDPSLNTVATPWVAFKKAGFNAIASTFTPVWTGTLTLARFRVETQSTLDELWIDKATLSEVTAYPARIIRAIHRQLISPNRA